eukprot:Gb_10590 [translate_table: standard]
MHFSGSNPQCCNRDSRPTQHCSRRISKDTCLHALKHHEYIDLSIVSHIVFESKQQAEIHNSYDSRSMRPLTSSRLLTGRLASTRPLRGSCRQADSSSPSSRRQSSITRFFPTASSVRRVSAPQTRSPHRVVQPSPIKPRLSSEDFIQQCIGSFTVVGDSIEMPSPSATITASIETLDAPPSVDVMQSLPLDVDGFAYWLCIPINRFGYLFYLLFLEMQVALPQLCHY